MKLISFEKFQTYSGDSLSSLIDRKTKNYKQERAVVQNIRDYIAEPVSGTVLTLTGIRNTGKTVAL